MTATDHFLKNMPALERQWHSSKNGSLKPSDVTFGSRKKVWWRCEKGHEWQAPVYSVSSGNGCPYCSGRQAIPGRTDLATTHPAYLALWHERNRITPDSVTASSHRKVWWRCEKDHAWEAMIFSVVQDGYGCPYCAGKRAIPGETDLATVRPDMLKQWDWEKNGKTDPSEILPSSHDKVWWKCELGHSWQAMVFSRTKEKQAGCPYCTGRKVLAGFNDLATLKPKLAKEWYQPLNGGLKPEDLTLGSNKKVWWQCGEDHVWQAAVYSRTRKKGAGCPVCAGVANQRRRSIAAPRQTPTDVRSPAAKRKRAASIQV